MKPVSVMLLTCLFSSLAWAKPDEFHGMTLGFGNMHAHSALSSDVKNVNRPKMSPELAWAYARDHGLDFLALTDHHKAFDAPGPKVHLTQQDYTDKLFAVAQAFNAANAGKFIALPGLEWGDQKTGNHINILGSPDLPPEDLKNGEYDKLYEWAASKSAFLHFNHPNGWKTKGNKAVGNYGQNLFASSEQFRQATLPRVRAVGIITTVAGGHLSGPRRLNDNKSHREMEWQDYYNYFLNLGLQISPSTEQDTHTANFGTVTAARTAVWMSSFDFPGLMQAFQENRIYATEDDELAVAFRVEHKGKEHWMGSRVLLAQEDDVTIKVRIWQTAGSDGDPLDEGPYTVRIYFDSDGIGGAEAAPLQTIVQGIPTGVDTDIPIRVAPGQYFYLEATEEGGKDNADGDGEDEVINSTGADGEDKLRDDLNDSAWTSPVWFELGEPAPVLTGPFVWSRNSDVYHELNCWAVKRIGEVNLRQGSAPADKTQHNCHP